MFEEYCRQELIFGEEGQKKLEKAKVLIVGVGATGSLISLSLKRAGVKNLTVMDHDVVDVTNVHRQILFNEEDLGKPKAQIIGEKLRVKWVNKRFDGNVNEKFDVVMDGTDNFETRRLIDEYSQRFKVPWVFCSAIRGEGMVTTFNGSNYVFNNVFKNKQTTEKCSEEGIINAAAFLAASVASGECQKLLTGFPVLHKKLFRFNLLKNEFQVLKIK